MSATFINIELNTSNSANVQVKGNKRDLILMIVGVMLAHEDLAALLLEAADVALDIMDKVPDYSKLTTAIPNGKAVHPSEN